jgi:hypothetical protein
MAKRSSGGQIEMLLPITGKKTVSAKTVAAKTGKPARTVSYENVVEALRKKGLTRKVAKT